MLPLCLAFNEVNDCSLLFPMNDVADEIPFENHMFYNLKINYVIVYTPELRCPKHVVIGKKSNLMPI